MDDIYREQILDHYHNPRNFGWIESCGPDEQLIIVKASNASCGDDFELALVTNHQSLVTRVAWRGEGCAISTASMSMVSEWMVGQTLDEIKNLSQTQILEMMGMSEITLAREKCLYLPLQLLN